MKRPIIILALLAFVGLVATGYWFHEHPCLREVSYDCERRVCGMYIWTGKVLICTHYRKVPDVCATCVERKP